MMTEVGGKLKAGLLVASVALFGVLAFSARTADIVKIKGEACEKFVPGQSKSSIRVRVTDKASYKAVSQVENLADVRSRMLEHDFNVIVYNLVDNYVRDLMVRTTSQNDKELCVKVTGALLASDIDTVVANYSPNTPAPEYDIKEAAGIEEEVLTEEDELEPAVPAEPDAEVLYSGPEELEQERQAAEAAETETALSTEILPGGENALPVVYGGGEEVKAEESAPSPAAGTEETAASDDALSENEEMSLGELPPPPAETPEAVETNASANETRPTAEVEPEMPATAPTPVTAENVQPAAQPAAPVPVIEEKANVYVGPVEFNNNTHSAKPSQVLKDMFADTEGYRLVDNPGAAGYVFLPKVLKAKVDALNSQTKRIQMVVSLQLQVQIRQYPFPNIKTASFCLKAAKMSRKLPRSCCISCCARPAANCSKKWNRRKPSAKRRDCRKSLRRQNKYTGEIKSPPGTILRRGFLFLRCLKLLCTGRAKFTLPTPASFPPVPASSGFTPASVLHPYTHIRSYF